MKEQLHKYFHGELEEKERLKLLREIDSDDELKKNFIELKNLYALVSYTEEMEFDSRKSTESYQQFVSIYKNKLLFNWMIKLTGIAAAIVSLIAITYFYTVNQEITLQQEQLISLQVPAGQRLNLTLQDGTKVWLNSCTKISYPASFSKQKRWVSIEGEALFDVVHESERPFVVMAKDIEINVLGTRFNVYSYPQSGIVKTSLLEGSLKVFSSKNESQSVLLKPNQEVIIQGNKMQMNEITDFSYFLWTDGLYSFYNEPLANILKKLELYFDVEINVKDSTIYTSEYTGKFRQQDGLDEILRIINKIHKFKVSKDEDNNVIILSH